MIPHELMLGLWIPVSALLMIDRNAARGFSLAMILGLLLLPSGRGLIVVGLPDLEKANVAALGALVGTMVFHPDTLLRFRPHLADLILLIVAGMMVGTSVTNAHGLYDGLSNARTFGFNFILPVFLARVHLSTPNGFGTFLYILVVSAAGYAVLALWEFRMSPQLHTTVYGYFPHTWLQFRRGGFWRPLVFFGHALALGRFFAVTAFLAMLPLRSMLAKRIPFGGFLFLAPSAGLLASMSYGPYALFASMCGCYLLLKRWEWLVYAVPAAASVWMLMVLAGMQPLYGVTHTLRSVNAQRADSLQYRLDALDEYNVIIKEKPLFGHGGWSSGRTSRATDSSFLIMALSRGLLSAWLLFGWWLMAMHASLRLARRFRGSPISGVLLGLALALAVCFAISMIDKALDLYLAVAASAVLGLQKTLRQGVPAPAGAPAMPRPAAPGYVYPTR